MRAFKLLTEAELTVLVHRCGAIGHDNTQICETILNMDFIVECARRLARVVVVLVENTHQELSNILNPYSKTQMAAIRHVEAFHLRLIIVKWNDLLLAYTEDKYNVWNSAGRWKVSAAGI